MYPYPALSDAAEYGRYLAAVARKIEQGDRKKVIKSLYVISGALTNVTIGEPDGEVASPMSVAAASVPEDQCVVLSTEAQILSVLENLEDADDHGTADVRSLGLIGNAGRALLLKLVQQALKAALENLDMEEIIKKLLGGIGTT